MSEQWIATRLLLDRDGRRVEVAIGVPYDDGRNWYCPYRVDRAGEVTIKKRAGGVDGLQALALASEALSQLLEQSGETLTWHVLENGVPVAVGETGDTGIYRLLPAALGFPFYKKMRQLVEDEVAQLADELVRRRLQRDPL